LVRTDPPTSRSRPSLGSELFPTAPSGYVFPDPLLAQPLTGFANLILPFS
jgi:transketolase